MKLVVDKADDGSARSWWEVIVSQVPPKPPAHACEKTKRPTDGKHAP